MNTKLGIASKVKKIHDKKNPLDSVDLEYGSIRDYLRDTWTSLLDEGFVKSEEARRNLVYKLENPDVYNYERAKTDAIDQGKYSKVGFCSDVAEAQLEIVGKNKLISFSILVSNFKRYNYATFYVIIVNGRLCITNSNSLAHSISFSDKEIETSLNCQTKFKIAYYAKLLAQEIYKIYTSYSSTAIKEIASLLMENGNETSGNLALFDMKSNKLFKFHHSVFSSDNGIPKKVLSSKENVLGVTEFSIKKSEYSEDDYYLADVISLP